MIDDHKALHEGKTASANSQMNKTTNLPQETAQVQDLVAMLEC